MELPAKENAGDDRKAKPQVRDSCGRTGLEGRHSHGEHYCALYDSDVELRGHSVSFIRQGIVNREKTIYVAASGFNMLVERLRGHGLDVEMAFSKAQLHFHLDREFYFRRGAFTADETIGLMEREIDRALDESHPALRVVSDMAWVGNRVPGCEQIVAYESSLNRSLAGRRCSVLCLYDRRHLSSSVLLHVLTTHPKLIVGSKTYRNPYYGLLPLCTGKRSPRDTLTEWLDGILREDCEEAAEGP